MKITIENKHLIFNVHIKWTDGYLTPLRKLKHFHQSQFANMTFGFLKYNIKDRVKPVYTKP